MNITHKTLAIIAAGIVACCAAPAFANPSGDGGNGGINVDDATIPSQSAVSYTVVLQGNQTRQSGSASIGRRLRPGQHSLLGGSVLRIPEFVPGERFV